jgi:hypothetical protein
VADWDGKNVVGKLYWNILNSDNTTKPNVKISGSKKLKSSLKESSFQNNEKKVSLEKEGKPRA